MSDNCGPHISDAEVPKLVEAIALADGDIRRDLIREHFAEGLRVGVFCWPRILQQPQTIGQAIWHFGMVFHDL